MTWHVPSPSWEAYAAGTLNTAASASIETHLMSCPQCRERARGYSPSSDRVWLRVHTAITEPRLSRPLRLLARLGVPDEDLVVMGASDALTISWSVAVGGAVSSILVTALAGARQELAFLLLVPLVQVLSVIASFAATDTLRELTTPTSLSKLRVALLRTGAALSIAMPATMAVCFLIPNLDALAFAWLLPSLGLVVGALVLHTWLAPWTSAGIVTAIWAAIVISIRSELTTTAAQGACAAAAVGFAVIFVVRTTTVSTRGMQ